MVVIDELVDEEVFSPQVSWAQRKETISLKVHIAEAKVSLIFRQRIFRFCLIL